MINLIEKLRDAGLEPHSYSGRAMYGKQCVGVDGDARELCHAIEEIVSDCLSDAFGRGQEEADLEEGEEPHAIKDDDGYEYENPSLEELQKFCKVLLSYRQDQMGLGQIYYWPSIEWKEEEEE